MRQQGILIRNYPEEMPLARMKNYEWRPLQNPKEAVILSSAKNLNMLNGSCLQILHCVQNDKIRSFAKVSNENELYKLLLM